VLCLIDEQMLQSRTDLEQVGDRRGVVRFLWDWKVNLENLDVLAERSIWHAKLAQSQAVDPFSAIPVVPFSNMRSAIHKLECVVGEVHIPNIDPEVFTDSLELLDLFFERVVNACCYGLGKFWQRVSKDLLLEFEWQVFELMEGWTRCWFGRWAEASRRLPYWHAIYCNGRPIDEV